MRGQKHLGLLVTAMAMCVGTPIFADDHPLATCKRSYRKAYDQLSPDQQLYVRARSGTSEDLLAGTVETNRSIVYLDVEGDGVKKEFVIESRRATRICEGDPANWRVKKNFLIYESPDGRRRMVDWLGGIVTQVGYDREAEEIILKGHDMDGAPWEERVVYDTGVRYHVDGITVKDIVLPGSKQGFDVRVVNARQNIPIARAEK